MYIYVYILRVQLLIECVRKRFSQKAPSPRHPETPQILLSGLGQQWGRGQTSCWGRSTSPHVADEAPDLNWPGPWQTTLARKIPHSTSCFNESVYLTLVTITSVSLCRIRADQMQVNSETETLAWACAGPARLDARYQSLDEVRASPQRGPSFLGRIEHLTGNLRKVNVKLDSFFRNSLFLLLRGN